MRYSIPYVLILLCSIFFQGAQISSNPKVSTPYQSYRIEAINPTHILYKKLSVVLVSAISIYTIAEKNTKDRVNKAKIVAETALKIAEEKQRNAETERDGVREKTREFEKNLNKMTQERDNINKTLQNTIADKNMTETALKIAEEKQRNAETERDGVREKTREFEKNLNKMTQERDNINKTLQNTIADKNMTETALKIAEEKQRNAETERDGVKNILKKAETALKIAEEKQRNAEKERDNAILAQRTASVNQNGIQPFFSPLKYSYQ